jgi:hypothetical protein
MRIPRIRTIISANSATFVKFVIIQFDPICEIRETPVSSIHNNS